MLEDLDALRASDAVARLAALDDLDKQFDLLTKTHTADKAITERLTLLGKLLNSRRKQAEADVTEAEDGTRPAVLTRRMTPLLCQVAVGVSCQAGIAMLGKQTLVLVSKRPAEPLQRMVMTTELSTTAGVKFLTGQCLFERNAQTLVLETKVAGLAQRLRIALQASTDRRLKVRLGARIWTMRTQPACR